MGFGENLQLFNFIPVSQRHSWFLFITVSTHQVCVLFFCLIPMNADFTQPIQASDPPFEPTMRLLMLQGELRLVVITQLFDCGFV